MDKIAVLDFGGQYSHLIARRIRELGVFSEVFDPNIERKKLAELEGLEGIVLSGGASSVYEESSPRSDPGLLEMEVPVLGICYGHQLIAHQVGGDVHTAQSGEYGNTDLSIKSSSGLLAGLDSPLEVWMNHKDRVSEMPEGYEIRTPIEVFTAFSFTRRSPIRRKVSRYLRTSPSISVLLVPSGTFPI